MEVLQRFPYGRVINHPVWVKAMRCSWLHIKPDKLFACIVGSISSKGMFAVPEQRFISGSSHSESM